MSIWSRSHRDLAKLAKDLQERNNRVKANAATRGKGAAQIQASSSEIAVLRERSLAADTSQRKRSGDRTKSVRFLLSNHDCLDEMVTEAELSDNGHCDTRKKYNQISVDKDLINYEKRQANTRLSKQVLNEESKIKSTTHGKEPSEALSEEHKDEHTTPSPTTENSNSNESLSADKKIAKSDTSKDNSSGSKVEEKGVSRQILFLLQKDFINSSKGDSKQCLNLTDLEGLLSLLLMSRSTDAEDKHENMIRMVETLILKQKLHDQKQGQEQHNRDDVNDINIEKDKITQRGLIPSKIPRKHVKKMAATKTDDGQKYDVKISNIENQNGMDQEHKNDKDEWYSASQNGNTPGRSEDEVTADGQPTRNVSDGNRKGVMRSNDVGNLDVLEERSEEEQDEMKESCSVKKLLPVLEHEPKANGVVVRCGYLIGESGSTSQESSDVTQGSGTDKVSEPGEYCSNDRKVTVDRCIQAIPPADDDVDLHVGCDSSGEENGSDLGQDQDLRQISRHMNEQMKHQRDSGEENCPELQISVQELELRQMSEQEQVTWRNFQSDLNGEENRHDSHTLGHRQKLRQISRCNEELKEDHRSIMGGDKSHESHIISCKQVNKGDCQSNSGGEENIHDSLISEQEQLMQISRYKKELKKHKSYSSVEDHSHYSHISTYKEATTGDCHSDSSMEKHGYDSNTTGQVLKEEGQHDRRKLLNSVDVSDTSLSFNRSKSSLAWDPLDHGEHMLQSPSVSSDTPVANQTSQIDDSGTTVSSVLSLDSCAMASLANSVQHTDTGNSSRNKAAIGNHSEKRHISCGTDRLTDDSWWSNDSSHSSFSRRVNSRQCQIHTDTSSSSSTATGSRFMRASQSSNANEVKHGTKERYFGHEESSSSDKNFHSNCSDIESEGLMHSRNCQVKAKNMSRNKEMYCNGVVLMEDTGSRSSQSEDIYHCTCQRCESSRRTQEQSIKLHGMRTSSKHGGIKCGKSTMGEIQYSEISTPRRTRPIEFKKCFCPGDRQIIWEGEPSLPLEKENQLSKFKTEHGSRSTIYGDPNISSTTYPCCDCMAKKKASKCFRFNEESDQSVDESRDCGCKHDDRWNLSSSSNTLSGRASKHRKSGHSNINSNMSGNMILDGPWSVSGNGHWLNGQVGRQCAATQVCRVKPGSVQSAWSELGSCLCPRCSVEGSDSSQVSGVAQNSDSPGSSRPSNCSPSDRSKHDSFHEHETMHPNTPPLHEILETLSSDMDYANSQTCLEKDYRYRVKPSVHRRDKQLSGANSYKQKSHRVNRSTDFTGGISDDHPFRTNSYKHKGHRVKRPAEPTVPRSDRHPYNVNYDSGHCETAVENSYETDSKSSMEILPADSKTGSGDQLVDIHTLQDILVDFQQLFVCLFRDCQHLEQEENLCEDGSEVSSDLVETAPGAERMESPESSLEQLDSEFDKVLVDMKPYVLKLPHKADRQRCAVWIKKLCEPPAAGVTGRKNRNMYGQLMLHMLRRGVLEGPFDKRPSDGSLPTLPPYMSIYFDEPMTGTDGQAGEVDKVPDWVNGELLESVGSSLARRSLGNPAATSTWLSGSSTVAHDVRERFNAVFYSPHRVLRPYSSLGVSLDKDPSLSPPRRRTDTGAVGSLLTSDMDWSKPYSSTTSLASSLAKGTTFHDDSSIGRGGTREIELRTKMVEAKYHEEKLKLQQRHDAAVQKILDRKNAEIEDVKSHYRGKAKDMEDTITKLERKIQSLMKEMSVMRDMKDRQLADLKKLVDDTSDSRKNEYDKKLHDTTAHFEQEKFEMQKQHTKNIQEILDDTNARLQRMEKEYTQQMSSNTSVIRELESRVQQLTSEVEQQLKTRSGLEEEKTTLQSTCDQLTAQLGDVRDSYNQLDREHQHVQESHQQEMRTLKHKTEASLEFLKQEHTLAAAKAADAVRDMELQLESMRRSMKESDEQRQKHIRDLDQVRQQEKLNFENQLDKQIRSMKQELEQMEQQSQKKIRASEHLLQEKDLEIQRLREHNKNQALSAERALEEFKAEVEKNQNRVYEEMKQQMAQVESDLNKSKHSREKQNKELSKQLEQERGKFNREIAEAKLSFEHERSQMLHDLHLQKEYILSEHEKAVETLKEGHRVELRSLEARYKERSDKDTKNMAEFEGQVRELREELVQSNQLRKQQLVELGLLREEEKQKMLRDHEAEMSRMRRDIEQQRLELQKLHSSEMETMLEKTNHRLKEIEKEYSDRGQKSTEVVADLQAATNQLREEIKRIRQQCDERMNELATQHEQDKKAMKKQYTTTVTALQKELDSQRNKSRNMERQLQRVEADQEEKITRLKLNHEEKLRGLMPAVVREELEDTIRSLRSQVNSLQQRAAVLQDELDLKIKNPLGSFGTLTSSPIIKSSV